MINIYSKFNIKDNKYLYRVLNDKRKFKITSSLNIISKIDLVLIDIDIDCKKDTQLMMDQLIADREFNGYFVLFTSNLSRGIINAFSSYYVIRILEKDKDTLRYAQHFNEILHSYNQRLSLRDTKMAVVDDDVLQQKLMVDILSRYKIRNVDIFSNYKDFEKNMYNYDIYLIDMILPDIHGEEIIIRIRNQKPKALIMAISSVERLETITSVLYNGADDYFVKPISHKLLISKLYSNFRYQRLLIENEEKEKKLKELSIKDGLTGLYNHKYMYEQLTLAIKRYYRHKKPLSIIMIDLDNFKMINDKYGHVKGDEILRHISKILDRNSREGELVGRYGGEEFIILLPNVTRDQAVKAAERLRKEIEESQCNGIYYTASFGVYMYESGSPEKFVSKADQLLYEAKKDGKNSVAY